MVKKLEKELVQMKLASAGSGRLLGSSSALRGSALAGNSGAHIGQSGLNLSKMTEEIDQTLRSSPRLNNNGSSTFKLRIDTFDNKVKLKRKEFPQATPTLNQNLSINYSQGQTNEHGHVEFINSSLDPHSPREAEYNRGSVDGPRKLNSPPNATNLQNKNPFDMYRMNS